MPKQSNNIKQLITFFNQNKSLTQRQRARFTTLLVRDYNEKGLGKKQTPSEEGTRLDSIIGGLTYHDPMKVVRFLHQFTEYKCKALKYTTHFWDKNPNTNEYDYTTFDQFKEAYKLILENGENKLDDIRPLCEHLWQLIRNFLVIDDEKYSWGKYKFRIGYNKYLRKWMDEHPGEQPFNMPLDTLPEELQPKEKVKGKTLVYFNDVVNVFKNCIEFRDNALYFAVKKIFKNADHNLNEQLLETLRGFSFFTDTELIKSALQTIAGNIFQRPQYQNIEIECKQSEQNGQSCLELRITQVGSFAEKETTDPKITGKTEDSIFMQLKKRLVNLCDFYVESSFKVHGETKECRLWFLASDKQAQWIELLPISSCKGFTYVLNFKTFNNK